MIRPLQPRKILTCAARAGQRCRRDGAGMTLIEALVALALLSLLAAGMLSAFSLAHRSYRQVSQSGSERSGVVLTQQFLRRILESAYPIDPGMGASGTQYGLEGSRDAVSVVGPMPRGLGPRGHYRYRIALRSRPDGLKDWVLTSGIDALVSGTEDTSTPDTLLSGIQSVEWSYLEPLETQGSPGQIPDRWRVDWEGRAKLPLLVRAHVVFPPSDERVWPDLLVAPMITEAASCVFDAVSQRCRESQP